LHCVSWSWTEDVETRTVCMTEDGVLLRFLIDGGCVDIPDTSQAALAERWRINQQSPGFGARTFAHVRRYRVGETITLSTSEAARLAGLGIVEWRPDTASAGINKVPHNDQSNGRTWPYGHNQHERQR
jgi:hypothetical protein